MYTVTVLCDRGYRGEEYIRHENRVKGLQDLHERMECPYKIVDIKDERGNRVYMKDFPL